MLQPRLQGPWKALDTLLSRKSFLPAQRSISTLSQLFSNPRRPQASGNGLASSSTILSRTARVFAPGVAQVRHAGHNAQGRANAGTKNGPGKRLGAKKASGQYVVPGNIIFRQRGTVWYPGENCGVGRDHSIFALEKGYVKYYKDPARHPDKKYIGVALARDDVLPYPKNAPSKRRLGMLPFPRVEEPKEQVKPGATSFEPTMHAGYVFRESNWQIGRVADLNKIKVRGWDRKDRWFAWRKKTEKIRRNAQLKDAKNKRKGKKK